MRIELIRRFLDAAGKLPADEARAVDEALATLVATFGRPHQHVGKSVRYLREDLFELRASRSLRVIFVRAGSVLRMDFVGDHDAVADYLRNRR